MHGCAAEIEQAAQAWFIQGRCLPSVLRYTSSAIMRMTMPNSAPSIADKCLRIAVG